MRNMEIKVELRKGGNHMNEVRRRRRIKERNKIEEGRTRHWNDRSKRNRNREIAIRNRNRESAQCEREN